MNEKIYIDKEEAKKFGIDLIYIFGSILKDKEDSKDLDMGILFSKNISTDLYFNYLEFFKISLQKCNQLKKEIDITILNLASALLKYEVVTKGIHLFMKDEYLRDEFELKVYKEYNDYLYRERFYEEALIQRTKKGV